MAQRWSPLSLVLALAGCTELDPLGEVRLFVDTDVPVPNVVNRLRVDLFTPDGRWFESRDIRLPDPANWPASFTVVAPEERDAEVLVRLRAYPEGRVRPYVGERYQPDVPYVEPFSPETPFEMCGGAPLLELGSGVRLRRGEFPFMPVIGGACGDLPIPVGLPHATTTGAVAARIEIPSLGDYRFEVIDTYPAPPLDERHVMLELRTTCGDENSWLACAPGVNGGAFVSPSLVVEDLGPGTYYLVAAGAFTSTGADITIAAASVDGWSDLQLPTPPDFVPEPVLVQVDGGITPTLEPMPESAIDRLVRVDVDYGRVSELSVVLHGDCSGTMAKLLGDSDEPRTCIDRDKQREPVPLTAGVDATGLPLPSRQGTFGEHTVCPDNGDTDTVVCVPGGSLLLGVEQTAGLDINSSIPERLATVERFWMDRYELTVGRFRAVLAAGYDPEPPLGMPLTASDLGGCRWTPEAGAFEDHPLNCTNQLSARAICDFIGGRLPTDSEWEYVAMAVSRVGETPYPWGRDPPRCSCDGQPEPCHSAQLAKGQLSTGVTLACYEPGQEIGTASVFDFAGPQGDVSVGLGVVGLAGNVMEWVADAMYPYDYPCWRGSFVRNRSCVERRPPTVTTRGGAYFFELNRVATRDSQPAATQSPFIGFRCVYDERPPWP